jgi:hypothetical protein
VILYSWDNAVDAFLNMIIAPKIVSLLMSRLFIGDQWDNFVFVFWN